MLFSGSAIASMIMASSLEIGKLVATTFLYRYWKRSQLLLKTYLILAVVALMFITSLGIFGYLTSAYQQSAIENKLSEEKIVYIQDQKKMYSDKISDAKKRIENISKLRVSQEERLNESMTNVIISRNPIQLAQIQQSTKEFIDKSEKDIDTENNKIQSTVDEIQKLDKQISDIKIKSGGQKDLQTFKFVADEFGVDINKVVKWFIICLISVFDPLETGKSYGTPHDLASLYGKGRVISDPGNVPTGYGDDVKLGRPTEKVSNINTQQIIIPTSNQLTVGSGTPIVYGWVIINPTTGQNWSAINPATGQTWSR